MKKTKIKIQNIKLTIRRAMGILLLLLAISMASIILYAVFEFFIHLICFGMYKSTMLTKYFFSKYL